MLRKHSVLVGHESTSWSQDHDDLFWLNKLSPLSYVGHYLGEANEHDVFVLRSVIFGVCDRGAVMRNASAPLFPLPLVFPLGEVGSTDLGRRNGQRASITLKSLYKHIYTASRKFLSPKKCYYSLGMQTAFPGEARTAVITDRCPEAKYPRSTTTQRQMGFLFVESFKMTFTLKSKLRSDIIRKTCAILYFCVHSLQNYLRHYLWSEWIIAIIFMVNLWIVQFMQCEKKKKSKICLSLQFLWASSALFS